MLHCSQISKLPRLKELFLSLSSIFLLSASGSAVSANEPAKAVPAPAVAAAPGATAAPVAPAAIAAKPSKGDATAGEALYNSGDASRGVLACITCHGPKGMSAVATWPKLAAQHGTYLTKQLKSYKDGSRANPIMMGMAATLTEQDMLNLAAYLVKQAPPQGEAQDKATLELGQLIYRGGIAAKGIPACSACHSPNGAGIPAQYPRLGGQWAEYNAAQLGYFRDGTRKNVQMNMIAVKLSDLEMKAVTDYMAGLH